MQTNIITDIDTLMKIPTKISKEITDKACLCISSAISEAKHAGETQVIVGIGLGTLSINLIDMQCKFIPGKALKTAIKNTLLSKNDPLELELESALADKLIAICDEVL